jgi:hypothetical protein
MHALALVPGAVTIEAARACHHRPKQARQAWARHAFTLGMTQQRSTQRVCGVGGGQIPPRLRRGCHPAATHPCLAPSTLLP